MGRLDRLTSKPVVLTGLVILVVVGLVGDRRSGRSVRTTEQDGRPAGEVDGARRRRLSALLPSTLYWAVPVAALFLVVLCTWTGPFGDRMNLSGDDSHLYYLDPGAWLRNAPLSTLDAGLLGYNSRVYLVPFLLLLRGIELTGLNVQGAALGLLVGLGWAGTASLVLCALGRRDTSARAAAAVAGLITVLAPTVASTQYVTLLLGIYWIALLPWLLVIVIRHQQSGRRRYLVAAVVATTLGAPALAQAPWTIGMIPMTIGAFAVLAGSHTFRFRPARLALLLGVLALANAWWVIPTGLALGGAQANASAATSTAGATDAYAIISTLAPLQDPIDAISLRQSYRQQLAFHSVLIGVEQDHRRLWPLGLLPVATISVAMFLAVRNRRPSRNLLVGCSVLVVVNLFFITVRLFGLGLGLAVYRFLLRVIPPFSGIRNFYDRFAIPFALAMALALGLALADLLEGARVKTQVGAAILFSAAMLVYGSPGLVGTQLRLPYYAASPKNRVIDGLPAGYVDLLKRLEQEPPGPVLTVPLLTPAWSTVSEAGSTGAYVGISPIVYLTGRTDYNGLDAFTSSAAPQLRRTVAEAVQRGDARAIAGIVSELAVQWIVVQLDPGPGGTSYRVAANPDPGVSVPFQKALLDDVAPEIVGTFGTYQLRKVRAEVRRPIVGVAPEGVKRLKPQYLADRAAGSPEVSGACPYADVRLRHANRSGTRYEADVDPTPGGCALVVRTAYDGKWSAVAKVAGRRVALTGGRALGFANGWELPAGTTAVVVEYRRQRLLLRSAALTATLIPLTGLVAALSRRRRRRAASLWPPRWAGAVLPSGVRARRSRASRP